MKKALSVAESSIGRRFVTVDQTDDGSGNILGNCDCLAHSQGEDAPRMQEAEYKKFFDAACDMRFIVTRDWKFIDVNQAGVEIFRFESRREMLQLSSVGSLYCNVDDIGLLQGKMEDDGFVRDYMVEMKRKDGSVFLASITANLWSEENGVVYYEGLLRDVTEYRKWQNALIETERYVRDLKKSEEHSRQLNHHVMQVLSLMSHDIRGPLVAIAATLKLLLRGTYGNMDESVRNTVRDLLSRAGQLLGVAEDYLSRAHSVEDHLKAECEMLDLRHDIIDPVLCELSQDIQSFRVRIDNRLGAIPAGTISVNVSKIWLKAVFRNLFKNAIKHGGEGCSIAYGFEDHGSYYRLNVYNSGKPIPEDQRDRLFTKFGRIGGQAEKPSEGVGLGLYLIREIIRKHGGDIWYEPKRGGSDFVFTLIKEQIDQAAS
jgi:PAS domain S-box-containing protein